MTAHDDHFKPSWAELFEFFGRLALVALLAFACVSIPMVVASSGRPWMGALVAVGAFWVWNRLLLPRSISGFLPSAICFWGNVAIHFTMVTCVVRALR